MVEDEKYTQSVKSLLEDVIANQHSLHATLSELYEKVLAIELQLGATPPEDEYALEEAVDSLYDQACACAETGVHISVPYLVRELQTNAAVAHEIIERLRIDGLLDGLDDTTEEGDGTDVFTTIDLREINDSAPTATPTAADTALYEAARSYVVQEQNCSQTALMKALNIKQAAARKLLTELETEGVVSAAEGRKGRTVLVTE